MAAGPNLKRYSRIFHIANECYIIYLGIKTDEDRPFLRVGNSSYIEEKILNVISNTVISSRFTGNPLYELKLDKQKEINYIGDTAVIKRMKTYLDSFQLPSDGAVDYHKIKDREQRDVVYFYNNGNIRLNYKEEPIFDLYKRAESDRHFVYQCDEIKKQFSRNPLRYTKHDFRESGVLLSGGSTIVYHGGRFFSASLSRDYFSRLAASGVDPDQINVHYSTIQGGDEGESASHALIEMLKRSSYRNTSFSIYARNYDYAKKIGALFPGANVSDSKPEWSELFYGLKVREKAYGLEVLCPSFPKILALSDGSPSDEHMSLNPHTRTLSIKEGEKGGDITIPEGIPCNIKGELPKLSEITDVYISRFVPLIKGFAPESDYKVSLAIQKLLKMLSSVIEGEAKSGLILRSSVLNFSDLLKNVQLKNDSILTYFLENVINILNLSMERASDLEGKISRNIHSLQNNIKSLLVKSAKADPLLPVAADVYTKGAPILFYKSVKSTAKKADYVLAGKLAKEILSEQDLSPRYYSDEKARLLKLIDMLESATDLEVDKILDSQKPSKPYKARKGEVIDERGKNDTAESVVTEKQGSSNKELKKVSRQRKFSLLWLLLIPLLAVLLWGGYAIYQRVDFNRDSENPLLTQRDSQNDPVVEQSTSDQTGNDQTTDDQTADDQAADDQAADDQTADDQTADDQTADDQTADDQTTDDQTTVDQTADNQTADNQTADDQTADNQTADDQTADDQTADDQTADDQTNDDQTNDDQTNDDQTNDDQTNDDQTNDDQTNDDQTNDEKVADSEKKSENELKLKEDAPDTENGDVESTPVIMETESRPTNAEEVKAYLNVGDFKISLVDIHLVSNKIAVDNNYRDLDYEVYDGADPDWIYPGNQIKLPDGTIHNVVSGDAIWYMAARYIRTTLDRDIPVFEANREKARAGEVTAISLLERLAEESPCEAFREKIHEVLKN